MAGVGAKRHASSKDTLEFAADQRSLLPGTIKAEELAVPAGNLLMDEGVSKKEKKKDKKKKKKKKKKKEKKNKRSRSRSRSRGRRRRHDSPDGSNSEERRGRRRRHDSPD